MFKRKFSKLVSFVLTVCLLAGVFTGMAGAKNTEAATNYADTSEYTALYDAFKDYFRVGVAIPNWNYYSGSVLEARQSAVLNIFNSVTCENEMKPEAMFSTTAEGLFKVSQGAQAMLVWAKANGMKLRGHTLVWHSQVNPAIFAKDFKPTVNGKATNSYSDVLDEECLVDADTLRERLKTYIYSVMEYVYSNGYGDVIYAWDVVNEAVDESNNDGLRKSTWYRILGPDFLYYAFLYAREASVKYSTEYAYLYGLDAAKDDLKVIQPKLFYNDYNEWYTARVNVITYYATEHKFNENRSLVDSFVINKDGDGTLKGDGLIDGVGMQGHLSDTNDIGTYITALRKYNEAVGEVHITELDVGCTTYGENQWYKQAKFYYDFFSAIMAEVKNGVNLTAVTLWGLTDESSWRTDKPLVLFGDLSMKPAYHAILMAANGEEFNLSLAESITELKDIIIDFEPDTDSGSSVPVEFTDVGILPRGTGHRPALMLRMWVNHTPDVQMGFALVVERTENDANVKIDVSKFCGRNITVTMYAKTKDAFIRSGIDGDEPVLLRQKASDGDEWVMLKYNTDIPAGESAFLYVETDGAADLFIDDISIIYTRDDEQTPVINETDDTVESMAAGSGDEASLNESASDSSTDVKKDTEATTTPSTDMVDGDDMRKSDTPDTLPIVIFIIAMIFGVVIILYRRKHIK